LILIVAKMWIYRIRYNSTLFSREFLSFIQTFTESIATFGLWFSFADYFLKFVFYIDISKNVSKTSTCFNSSLWNHLGDYSARIKPLFKCRSFQRKIPPQWII